jgi:hypothetical protein
MLYFDSYVVYLTAAGTAFTKIGWKFNLVFIIIPGLALPLIWRFFQETKGMTLEEVGALFGDGPALDVAHMPDVVHGEISETTVDRIKLSSSIQVQIREESSESSKISVHV